MKLYEELLVTYAGDIARAKELKRKVDELYAEANMIDPILHPVPDIAALEARTRLFEKAEKLYQERVVLLNRLDQDVNAAYHNVPFAKSREEGMSAFYRAAKL